MASVKVYTSYPINGTSVKGLGIRKTNQIPVSVESLCQFPDTPEIRATNIDPTKQYSISELHGVPSSFSELKDSRIGELLNYNRVIPGEFPCFNLVTGQQVSFSSIDGWDSVTNSGSAEISYSTHLPIIPTNTNARHSMRVKVFEGLNTSAQHTLVLYVKSDGADYICVDDGYSGRLAASFDVNTGSVIAVEPSAPGNISQTIEPAGDGYYKITLVFIPVTEFQLVLTAPTTLTDATNLTRYYQTFQGDGVNGIKVKKKMELTEAGQSTNVFYWEGNGYAVGINPIKNNIIEASTAGSLYDLKVFNANGSLINWFPVCDESGSSIANVINPSNKGTLPNALNWSTQNDFDYVGVYGSSKPKIFKIGKDDTVINTTSYLPTNLNRVDKFETLTGDEYNVSLTQDSAENLVNDPDGEPTGWTEINGQPTLNIYNNFASPDIVPVSGGNLISISGAFPASKIRIRLERLGTDLSSLSGRDATMASRFKKAVINMFGADPSIYLNTVDDFFKMLNGGVETSGAHPNGTNPNFPSDLGMTQANGFSVDLTNADIINAMDNGGVFTNQGTAELLMDGLVADGVHMNTEGSNRWSYPLTRMFNLSVGNGSTNYDITIDTNNLVSNGALSHFGDSFILAHEPILEMYSNMKFTFNYGGGTLPVWVRLYQFSIDELTEVKPANYIDRLKRSGTTTEGDQVQNHEELKSKGDIAFKAMAFTKSDL